MAPNRQPKRQPSYADRLQRVRRLYRNEKFSAAGRAAGKLLAELPQGTAFALRDAAMMLGVFAYAKAQEYERGWQLSLEHSPGQAGYLDFCYGACYLAYQRADYEATQTWGDRYLEIHAGESDDAPYADTRDKIHEVLNTLGCAAKDRGADAEALTYLERAMAVAPTYALPYINAVLVCQRSGQTKRAERFIEAGLKQCGEIEELHMLASGDLRDQRISLCMIVKDEEEMLPDALASVKDVVDEIILVDTGSTDRTVEIGTSFGARIYHHPWQNDFSHSRNLSIGYATGDWVLILDADERLDRVSAPLVRKLAATCRQEAVSFSVYNVDLDNDHVSFLPSIRMFRNGRGYGYRGIVHNQIDIPPDTAVLRAPVRIDHYGYTPSIAERRGKFARTTELLRQQLEANPDDAFAHFNMAQIMRGGVTSRDHAPEILHHARRVTELLEPGDRQHQHILLMAYHQMASSHFVLEEYDAALQACRTALELKPDFIDALMTMGHTLSMLKRVVEARHAFQEYLSVREQFKAENETDGFILLNLETQHQAYYGLGLIEEAAGEHLKAVDWYRKILPLKDDYLETHIRLGHGCYKLGDWAEAAQAFECELECRPQSFWAHYCLGDIAAREESWERAYDHYHTAFKIQPEHPHLPLNLATCAFRAGRLEAAGEWFAKVGPEVGGQPAAVKLQAAMAYARGDFDSARMHYRAYLEHDPQNAEAWSELGNACFKSEDLAEAQSCYERALTEQPDLQMARRNLALVFLRTRRYELARTQLEAYLASGCDDPDAAIMLADLLAGSGAHAEALPWFERYLAHCPQDHQAIFRLAKSYQAMGQEDAAIMGYKHLLSAEPGFAPAKEALAELQAS